MIIRFSVFLKLNHRTLDAMMCMYVCVYVCTTAFFYTNEYFSSIELWVISCGGPSASKQWWTEEGTDKETVDKYISDIVAKINI